MAICDYEPAELHARLMRLVAVRNGRPDIEYLERLLAMPAISTTFDSERTANYSVILRAAPGRTPWTALVGLAETYGPDIESRPARFRGTHRPARINPRERGDIEVSVNLLAPSESLVPGSSLCLSARALERHMRRVGWRESTRMRITFDAPPRPSLDLDRHGLDFSSELDGPDSDCVSNLTMTQQGSPPTVPITSQESDALRHASADRIAAEFEQRLAAQSAQDDDDTAARRAWARNLSDGYCYDYRQPEALEPTIGAMSIDQLRELAKRAVVGHYWGAWREPALAGSRRAAYRRTATGCAR